MKQSLLKKNKEIFYSIVFLVIPVTVFISAILISNTKAEKLLSENNLDIKTELKKPNVFDNLEIIGKSAIVKDLNTGEILYSKNSQIPLPLASITKVLTALTSEMSAKENYITIPESTLIEYGNSLLYPGTTFRKKDLIDMSLIMSSNDASFVLANTIFSENNYRTSRQIFIEEMNNIAKQIGMENSYFYNETGLDLNLQTAGAHGTSEDVVLLFQYILKNYPNLLEPTKKQSATIKSVSGLVYNVTNTNQIVGQLPNLLASKTGFTDIAGGNLAVVIDPGLNRPVAIVVLGSTESGRFEDVKKLANSVTEYFKNYK